MQYHVDGHEWHMQSHVDGHEWHMQYHVDGHEWHMQYHVDDSKAVQEERILPSSIRDRKASALNPAKTTLHKRKQKC